MMAGDHRKHSMLKGWNRNLLDDEALIVLRYIALQGNRCTGVTECTVGPDTY